jgi:hypothetical protein
MKVFPPSGMLTIGLIFLSSFSSAQAEQDVQPQAGHVAETIQFPPNDNCTANKPCRTVMGEIRRVEETYVLTQPNGSEIHVKIRPETKVGALHKQGDKVAAQLSSTGVAHAVVKLQDLPKSSLEAPEKTLDDLR